jgi:hypothetical protein
MMDYSRRRKLSCNTVLMTPATNEGLNHAIRV